MELTGYVSDLHGNTEYINAVNTVMNYMNEVYGADNALVVGGDFVGENKDLKNQQQVMSNQYNEAMKVNQAFSEFQGQVYGITGNWDSPITRQSLSNVQFIEYQPTDIHGKIHYGVTHSSANFFSPDEPHEINVKDELYTSLQKHFNEVKENIDSIDVLVAHEGPHKNFCHSDEKTGQGAQLHKGLEKLVEESGTSFFCGHVHGSLYEDFENGAYGMRACAENDKGSMFLRVQNEGKELLYEIGNQELLAWAKEINPSAKYKLSSQKKQEERERQMQVQQQFSEYVQRNHPDFVELNNKYKEKDTKIKDKYVEGIQAGKYEDSQENFANFIHEEYPEMIDFAKKYNERQKEIVNEFEQTQKLDKAA